METKTSWTHVDDGYLHKIVDGNGVEIASLNSAGDVADADNVANARLIAAAPDMAALLERILAAHRPDINTGEYFSAITGVASDARALLAKIKGADDA